MIISPRTCYNVLKSISRFNHCTKIHIRCHVGAMILHILMLLGRNAHNYRIDIEITLKLSFNVFDFETLWIIRGSVRCATCLTIVQGLALMRGRNDKTCQVTDISGSYIADGNNRYEICRVVILPPIAPKWEVNTCSLEFSGGCGP